MPEFLFTTTAREHLRQLGANAERRIMRKLLLLRLHPDVSALLKALSPPYGPGSLRLRIGVYRLLMRRNNDGTYLILEVDHRRDIYR